MSISSIQNELNTIDRDIASAEKKKAEADKKAAELEARILSVKKTITKNTTQAQLVSKAKQIEGYQRDSQKKKDDSADLAKKIARLREKRNGAAKRLQKAEDDERKAQVKSTKRMQEAYEERIRQLTAASVTTAIPIESAIKAEEITVSTVKPEYDVFISHAWEDKESFVDELVTELEALGIKPWYDRQRITWGDSMRHRIDEGLNHSKFGIVVISPNYIADGKYWTKAELDGLFQLESINGKMILPIWHNITKQQVMAFSSIVAGRLAMTTAQMTPAEIAAEMKRLLDQTESEE